MSEYLDAVRKEIDKQLGSTDDDAEAGSWDYAIAVALQVVGPLLEKRQDFALATGYDLGSADLESRLAASQADVLERGKAVDLLLWLHAEAVWWLQLDRDEHESAEMLTVWFQRAEYATKRYEMAKREVARLRREVEFEALGGAGLDGGYSRDNLRFPLCSCLTAEQVSAMDLTRWSLPQCAVHPTAREEGEECSGRDDTGQASREETPGNVSSRRLTTSGVPGPGDGTATPAPPSSRHSLPISTLTGQPCGHPADEQCIECVEEDGATIRDGYVYFGDPASLSVFPEEKPDAPSAVEGGDTP